MCQRHSVQPAALPPPSAAPTFTPPPPVVVSKTRGVEPQNMARGASRIGSDYPRRAQERGEEGTVGFRVTVGPNGRVETCDVTRSSGSAVLDKAACQGMRRFNRLTPALNDLGEPIASTWATVLEFRLK
jgi:protein TonB